MSNDSLQELLLKYAQGNCSPEEMDVLETLLRSSSVAEDVPSLEQIKKVFGEEGVQMSDSRSDRIFERIVSTRVEKKVDGRLFFYKIAASVAVVVALSASLYHFSRSSQLSEVTAYRQMKSVELPDGTYVKLNANTTIRTHKDFLASDHREVWIEGEAFFSVAHDEHKPFIVHTSRGLDIEVLGTEFNVNSTGRQTEVVLNKGSVKVKLEKDGVLKQEKLRPGEMIRVDADDSRLHKTLADTLYYASWKYNLLAFKGESLKDVLEIMQQRYGCGIVLSNAGIGNLRFTGSLPSNDLDLALGTITKTFNLHLRKDGKTFYLYE